MSQTSLFHDAEPRAVFSACEVKLNDDGSPQHPLRLAAALKPFPMLEAT